MVDDLYERSSPKALSARYSAALRCVAALFGMGVDDFLADNASPDGRGEIDGVDYAAPKALYASLVIEIGDRSDSAGQPLGADQLTKRAKRARHEYALWRKSQSAEPRTAAADDAARKRPANHVEARDRGVRREGLDRRARLLAETAPGKR